VKIVSWDELIHGAQEATPSVATIGVFDGVHLGHRHLLHTMHSQWPELRRIVVTFSKSPKQIMRPQHYHGDISTLSQKLEKLEEAGADLCVLIDFSENFSKMAGENFIYSLMDFGAVQSFVVGWNFAFGHNLALQAKDLPALAAQSGASAVLVDAIYIDGKPVSSSLIRSCIMKGRTDQALAMLGYPYTLDLANYKIIRHKAGVQLVPADSLYLPIGPGCYPVQVLTRRSRYTALLTVNEHNNMSWTSPSEEAPVRIEFNGNIEICNQD